MPLEKRMIIEENKLINKIAFAALLLYFIETTIDGTGRIVDFGFVSIQMLLFAFAFVATLPVVIKDFRRIVSNPCVVAVLVFAMFIIFSAVFGFARGNRLNNIRVDITSVLGLALLPGVLATINNSNRLIKAADTLFWAASAFSFVVLVLYCFYPCIGKEKMDVLNAAYSAGLSGDGVDRISAYFRVNALMIFFSVYGVFKLKDEYSLKWLLYLAEASLIMLILLSMERSSCLGLLVALLVVLAVKPKDIGHYLKSGLITLGIICIFFVIASLTRGEPALFPHMFGRFSRTEIGNSFDYDAFLADEHNKNKIIVPVDFTDPEVTVTRKELDNGKSIGADNFRKILVQRHEYFIKKHFCLGSGLGFDMNFPDGGKSEYMYLDFLMKLGIFGFLSFMAAYFTPVVMCFKRFHCELRTPDSELLTNACYLAPETLSLLAGYLGIATASYFEPYLTNPMGIMILCLLAASISIEINNDKQKQTTTESD